MNAPDGAGFLLVLDGVWLGALALGAVTLRREVAILRRRMMLAGGAVPDGLEVGAPVPRDADPATDRVLLFVYPHCEPCEELAPRLRFLSSPELLDVVVSGGDPHEPLLERLPVSVRAVSGSEGERLSNLFDVRSGPLAIAVRSGLIVAKGYINDTAEIEFLLAQAARGVRA